MAGAHIMNITPAPMVHQCIIVRLMIILLVIVRESLHAAHVSYLSVTQATGYVLHYLVILPVVLVSCVVAGSALALQHQLVVLVMLGAGLMIQIKNLNVVLAIMAGRVSSLLIAVTPVGKEKIAALATCAAEMGDATLQTQYYAIMIYLINKYL